MLLDVYLELVDKVHGVTVEPQDQVVVHLVYFLMAVSYTHLTLPTKRIV